YEFLVKNTGVLPINGFALGIGAIPAGFGANLRFAKALGGGDGPYPNILAVGGAIGPPARPLINGTRSAMPWGFEEFQDTPAGNLPLNWYVVRWYAPNQVFGPALPRGFTSRFDL